MESELPVAKGRENLCVQAFERLHSADGFTFRISSEIPLVGGMGSSAAAIVAGLMAADHLFELDADLLREASGLEGHPDNVAAALLGGFVVCADGQAIRFDPPTGLEALAVVPQRRFAPRPPARRCPPRCRSATPCSTSHTGRCLTLGLVKGDWDLLARGLHDRLHEQRRSALYPRSFELASRARQVGALGATISGAGPTVLVWCFYEQTGSVAEALRDGGGGLGDAREGAVRVPGRLCGGDVGRPARGVPAACRRPRSHPAARASRSPGRGSRLRGRGGGRGSRSPARPTRRRRSRRE